MGQVGGAATSGRGLTALQVAAALRATAEAHLKKEKAAAPFSQNTQATLEELADGLKAVSLESCSAVQRLTVRSTDDKGKGVMVHVTEYAPDVFYSVRRADGLEDSLFADEWLLAENSLSMEPGEGRSRAHFLKSKTMMFMCKTIAEEEAQVLLRILPAYSQHIVGHPGSFLMRFYMLLKISVQHETGYLLCFNDVFGAASVLHERWDIKGRDPKRGKPLRSEGFVIPSNEPDFNLSGPPKNRDETFHSMGDGSQQGQRGGGVARSKIFEGAPKLPTLHDKDLARGFWLPHSKRIEVLERLISDYKFMKRSGLMDYSLLIGVTYQDTKASRHGGWCAIENRSAPAPPGVSCESISVEMRSVSLAEGGNPLENRVRSSRKPPELENLVHSLHDHEVYYIGIIDILTAYTVKKKAANFFKSFLWKQKTLSTIPPDRYARRIISFTQRIFPEVAKGSGSAYPLDDL